MRGLLTIALLLLLASCGQGQQAKVHRPVPAKTDTSDDDQGAPPPFIPRKHDLRTFFHGSAPTDLPSYLPLYPDAKVVGGFERPSRFGAGGSIIYTCPAQPADIIAFYEKNAAAANFVQSTNNANGATLTYAARAGRRSFQVIAEPIPGGSHVQIFWTGAH